MIKNRENNKSLILIKIKLNNNSDKTHSVNIGTAIYIQNYIIIKIKTTLNLIKIIT
jgi:hypothetical protein